MKKRMTILMFLFVFSLVMVVAQDTTTEKNEVTTAIKENLDAEKKEEKTDERKKLKFPGKVGFEFSQRFDVEFFDNLIWARVKDNYSRVAEGADIYLRNELKLSFSFDLGKFKDDKGKENVFYTLTPWLKDRFDLRMNNTIINDAPSLPLIVMPRNRFYAGVDNVFKIPNIMNIGVNFETRIDLDDTRATLATESYSSYNKFFPFVEIKLSPMLDLSGSYKFGLSWKFFNSLNFYLQPKMYTFSSDVVYNGLELEGIYRVAFDFLTYIIKQKEDITGEFFIEDSLFAIVYADEFVTNKDTAKLNLRAHISSDLIVGFNFNLFGITPIIGLYLKDYYAYSNPYDGVLKNDSDNTKKIAQVYKRYNGLTNWVGFKTGIGYTKDWFSVSINYIGRYATMSNGLNVFDDANSELKDKIKWENHIDCTVRFKI